MVMGETGSEAQELKELIEAYRRRLHKLRVRVALMGIDARPEDLIEIEDIEKKLAELEEQLNHFAAIPVAGWKVPAKELEGLRYKLDRRIGVLEASLQYLTVSLRFSPRGKDKYEVLLQSEVGDVADEFVLPFTADEVFRFKSEVERAILARGSGFRGQLPSAMERLKEFGLKLYKGLPEAVRERYQAARDKAVAEGYTGVRLRLNLTDSRLAAVPWEFLYDLKRGEFLGLSGQTLLVRYAELPYPPTLGLHPPLKVLVVAPNPRDLPPLDAEQEHQRVEGALKDLEEAGLITIYWLGLPKRPISLQTLHDALFAFRPHLLHFIGHGTFDEQRGEGALFFEDEKTLRKEPVSSWRLAQLATSSESLRLVFLNACKGAKTSEVEKLSSLAASLAQKGIPAVIGMQFTVTDEAAIEFSSKFYQRLAEGAPVDAAVQEGRIHLGVVRDNPMEWAVPVLYLLPSDGKLFQISMLGKDNDDKERLARLMMDIARAACGAGVQLDSMFFTKIIEILGRCPEK
ncbi:MAG: CHAT domain-containing protein [Chloroflexi bacterium]|nr:CHAT domain-containing protein [Chloroflexota bacterium]